MKSEGGTTPSRLLLSGCDRTNTCSRQETLWSIRRFHPVDHPLAPLVSHGALDVMEPQDRPDAWLTLECGTRLQGGQANAVAVVDGRVESIIVDNPKYLRGRWSLGIRYNTSVVARNEAFAVMLYEPFSQRSERWMAVSKGRM